MSPTFHSKVLIFRALAVIDNRLLNSLYWGSVSGFGLCCHDGFEVQVLGYFAACPRGLNVAMYLVLCCILYLYIVFCAVFVSCDVSCICILRWQRSARKMSTVTKNAASWSIDTMHTKGRASSCWTDAKPVFASRLSVSSSAPYDTE